MAAFDEFLFSAYFDEINARERIVNRIQINLGIYITALAVVSYMARRVDYASGCIPLVFFWIGEVLAVVLLIGSLGVTLSAFTGYQYKFAPKLREIVNYDRDIKTNIKNGHVPKDNIDEYMADVVSECVDYNYSVNEVRRKKLSLSLKLVFASSVPLLVSCGLFVLLDMDASSPRKDMLISDRILASQVHALTKVIEAEQKKTDGGKQEMSEDENKQTAENVQQDKPKPPAPPVIPLVRPKIQISTESFDNRDKKGILKE